MTRKALLLLSVAGAAVAVYLLWKKTRGPYAQAQKDQVAYRDAVEAAARRSSSTFTALAVEAFREAGEKEVIVPLDDPKLRKAQSIGARTATRLGLVRFRALTDSDVVSILVSSGVS